MSVSGTFDRSKISVMSIMDKAFGRARIKPQQITSEMLESARDDLDLLMKNISATGVQLWCDDRVVVPLVKKTSTVDAPVGTADVDFLSLRKQSLVLPVDIKIGATSLIPYLGGDGYTPSTTDPLIMQIEESLLVVGADLQLSFLTSGKRSIEASFSPDGVTFSTPVKLGVSANGFVTSFVAGVAQSFSIDIPAGTTHIKVYDAASTAMDLLNFIIVNGGSERPLVAVGIDQIAMTGDSMKPGSPSQYVTKRDADKTRIMLWPVPDHATSLQYDLVVWRKRYIMDVGRLTNRLDLPDRWIEPIIWELAWRIAQREPEATAVWSEVKSIADEKVHATAQTERIQGPIKLKVRNRYGR